MELLSEIFDEGRGESFISFANAEGKRWIMPRRNMSTAMNLYQPGGIKGKLIKRLLPYVYRLPMVKGVVGFERIRLGLNPEIERLIGSIFGTTGFEFSVFGGTPSVHQKVTIQISRGNTILGYCKLTDNEAVKSIFRHEQTILERLQRQNMTQIPQCLYCGQATGNIDMFVQTTIKSNCSKVLHSFTAKHWDFLSKLHNNTRQNIAFEESDFYKSLISVRSYAAANQSDVVSEALDRVARVYEGREVCFSAYHGDFTPWNMFCERGELFVFDFEYAQMSLPPYLDWFHYFTQTAIFEKHMGAREIYESFLSQRMELRSYFENPNFAYICYLLSIMSLYIGRESGEIDGELTQKIELWVRLIDFLLKSE